MGKTRRYHGRENGDDAKWHRWWRKNENTIDRKDNDRFKVAHKARDAIVHEGVKLKTRQTAVPKSNETKGYGFRNHPFAITTDEDGSVWVVKPHDPEGVWG